MAEGLGHARFQGALRLPGISYSTCPYPSGCLRPGIARGVIFPRSLLASHAAFPRCIGGARRYPCAARRRCAHGRSPGSGLGKRCSGTRLRVPRAARPFRDTDWGGTGRYQASLLTLSPVTDFLSYGFIQRALITGTLLGVSCAVLAFFVVLRRMAFIGVGISHAALGGVALGVVLGISPVLAATVFSVGVAWVIGWIAARGRISEDTAIGIFFPTAMALGVALISLSPTYRQDLMGYLFGNILSVRAADVWVLAALAAVSLGILALFFKEFLFLGVDEEAARAAGLPAEPLRYLLLTVLAVTIVASMKLVGIVLVSAFLVIPAATGQAVARSTRGMLTVAVVSSLMSVVGGLWLSWLWNLPSGASIVLLTAALFFAAFLAGRRRVR